MKTLNYVLLALMGGFFSPICGQTIDILVHSNVAGHPEITTIDTAYQNAGFASINIISGDIDANLNTTNYDLAFITEYYRYDGSAYVPDFLTEIQRQQVENFIGNGGHVVWIAESWTTIPITGGPATPNLAAVTTINNLFSTNLMYGVYYANGGAGPTGVPRIHNNSGPGGLSVQANIEASGSYATLLEVPACSKVYTAESYDNTNFFETCVHTTLALFPATPLPTSGSVVISTEVGVPFHGFSSYFPSLPSTYNTGLDNGIATMHFQLLTGGNVVSTCTECVLMAENSTNFEANVLKDRTVLLGWRAQKDELASYVVERSKDGLDWEDARVLATVEDNIHEANDRFPFPNKSYYRLRSTAFDGSFTWSPIHGVSIEGSANYLSTYPNPTADFLTVDGSFEKLSEITFYDGMGKDVSEQVRVVQHGASRLLLDLSRLDYGIYFLKTSSFCRKISVF